MGINLIIFVTLVILTIIYNPTSLELRIFAIANTAMYGLRAIFHLLVWCHPKHTGRYSIVNMFFFLIETAIASYGIH